MREPEVLDFSPKNLAVETIEQFYFTVDPERKFDLLVKLLEREDPKQAIIFCRTKRGTDKICTRLSRRFENVDTIHGDLQQSSRDRVMKAFREGKVRWLVATDVVGRGIDVTGISHIINFDIPAFCDDYVHRVGRTGRMGREGVAYTFVSPEEGGELTRIEIRINRLLIRDEIPGFQAFDDPRAADSVVLGDGPGGMDDDLVEPPKSLPVFGKKVRQGAAGTVDLAKRTVRVVTRKRPLRGQKESGDKSPHAKLFPQPGTNHLQPLGQFLFEPAIDRAIVLALDAQIILRGDAAFGVVGILVVLPLAQPLGAGVVRVAEVDRHGQQAALADVLAGLADADRRGVRLRRTGQVGHGLGQRQLAFRQPDQLATMGGGHGQRRARRDRRCPRLRWPGSPAAGRESGHPRPLRASAPANTGPRRDRCRECS